MREGQPVEKEAPFNWKDYGIEPIKLDWELKEEELHFSMPMGIEMTNAVILKPYQTMLETAASELSTDHDESFFAMIDKKGKWLVTTTLKGFSTSVMGLASSYNYTGDIILIGKSLRAMVQAFNELKKQGGGLVLVENDEVIDQIQLPLLGMMSDASMEEIMEQERSFVNKLRERGYTHEDPMYSLQFFSSTHLPYIRVTQRGIYDVRKKRILFPAIMR